MKIIFIDKITVSSLLGLWGFRRSLETIWHFEPMVPSMQRLLGACRRLGLIRAEVRQIDHHIGEVRNEAAESKYVELLGDARTICTKIKREQVAHNPLIEVMGAEWATSKVLFYFDKLAEPEVRVECLRIGLVEWMWRTQLQMEPAQCLLLIEQQKWFSYLETYARSKNIQLIAYHSLWNLGEITSVASKLIQRFRKWLPALSRAIQSRLRPSAASARSQDSPNQSVPQSKSVTSKIAIRYSYRKLSFDPSTRSEFFWLNGSGIPYSEVLLYDYVTDKPLDNETLAQINACGLRILGRGPGIPTWVPTRRMFTTFLRIMLKLLYGILISIARKQKISWYHVRLLIKLAKDYAYWIDFYASHGVRVNIGTVNTSVGQVLALDALKAVSVAYQYSISNILAATTLLSAGENVQFLFSRTFERLWSSIEAPVDHFIHTGFIYDSAFQAIRDLDRVTKIRTQLQANGARFILCFFDENSINRWDIPVPNEEAASDYEYLLKWLLDDSKLGVIFKPKKSSNLFQRIGQISGLIEQAQQTGRCQFLTSDTLVGSIFPAEAALMADVCIGKLIGSTAALETRLVGVPTVLIDIEGLSSHPFHTWGRGRVVFDDWRSLRVAIEQYRRAPEAYPEFGDWSPGLDNLDPFQDGQASLRMGLYIRWVYEALKQGASKEAALAMASKKFAQRWGREHITMSDPSIAFDVLKAANNDQ